MSNLFYKTLKSKSLKKILADLASASQKLEIDFFGIGALARNVWYVENEEQARGTKDLDFAVYVPTFERYQALKNELINTHNYRAVSTNAFCLLAPDQTPLDLLPFGEIEKQSKESIHGKGILTIDLQGLTEVYKYGLVEKTIEGDSLQVCSIPSVVLLKLIAYDDRYENRPNDPIDIASILKYYPDIELEYIWAEYTFLYEEQEEDLAQQLVGIKVLGYEIGKLLTDNQQLEKRILHILDKAITQKSELVQRMASTPSLEESIDSIIEQLFVLKSGIRESLKKNSKH